MEHSTADERLVPARHEAERNGYCPSTGKRCHTQGSARLARRYMSKRTRIYMCPDCHWYHFTQSTEHADEHEKG